MDMNAVMLWATPIVEVRNPDHHKIKDALVRYCYEMQNQAAQPIESNVTPLRKRALYESRFDFFTRQVPEIQSLRQFCGQALSQSIFKLHQQATRGREPISGLVVDMHESWIHITKGDGGYHEVHTHANCSWCGIYYLEPGDCTMEPPDGINRFFSPIEILYEDFGTMAYPQKPVSWPPEEGKLVLFPSYVRHLAVPYHGKRDRIIVSFNSRTYLSPPGAQPPQRQGNQVVQTVQG